MRALVTGAKGMLGFALEQACPGDVTCVGLGLDELDVTVAAEIDAALETHEPDAVVNAAAYTDVDGCESHESEALAVNGTGAGLLARACAARGIPLLHVSTDYVFDGRIPAPGEYGEDDAVGPLSAYGRTKLAGEQAVRAAGGRHWIARTQWLYGLNGPNFVETMLRLAGERERLTIVDDQVGSPTCTHDLAPVLWSLVRLGPPDGIYHVASAGNCSWYEFARAIFEQSGAGIEVEPMDSSRLDRPAPRPARAVLNTARLRWTLGLEMPHWRESLERYLARRAAVRAPS